MGLSPRRIARHVAANTGRLVLALVLTVVVLGAGTAGMYVTSAPKWVSLAIEPFSLLLLPGLVVAIAAGGAHDFGPDVVVAGSAAFYFGFLYAGLVWLGARRFRRAG